MRRHDNVGAVPEQRLMIVSNRLPVKARTTGSDVRIVPSDGGLATALRPWHERSDALWIGWPGEMSAATNAQRESLDKELRELRIVPVHLSGDHIDRYYNGFANRVLWPLFHYLIDRLAIDAACWDAYQEVNEAFADVVAQEYRRNDTIWVHD
jgi:trehalose 6-phosphate synthase/phosphatase